MDNLSISNAMTIKLGEELPEYPLLANAPSGLNQ
jgi:hypothetical protein